MLSFSASDASGTVADMFSFVFAGSSIIFSIGSTAGSADDNELARAAGKALNIVALVFGILGMIAGALGARGLIPSARFLAVISITFGGLAVATALLSWTECGG